MDNEMASMTESGREEVVWLPQQQCKEGWLEDDCYDPRSGSHMCFSSHFLLYALPLLLPSQVQLFEHLLAPWRWLGKYGCNSQVDFFISQCSWEELLWVWKVFLFFCAVADKISIRTVKLSCLTVTQRGRKFMLIWQKSSKNGSTGLRMKHFWITFRCMFFVVMHLNWTQEIHNAWRKSV